ncbi:MAG: hypothetical protein GY858_04305 [Candidatus Omnitrophica bacterium]|nr:hypothetical protein [Candidatus Omnitrophota bacterium]
MSEIIVTSSFHVERSFILSATMALWHVESGIDGLLKKRRRQPEELSAETFKSIVSDISDEESPPKISKKQNKLGKTKKKNETRNIETDKDAFGELLSDLAWAGLSQQDSQPPLSPFSPPPPPPTLFPASPAPPAVKMVKKPDPIVKKPQLPKLKMPEPCRKEGKLVPEPFKIIDSEKNCKFHSLSECFYVQGLSSRTLPPICSSHAWGSAADFVQPLPQMR